MTLLLACIALAMGEPAPRPNPVVVDFSDPAPVERAAPVDAAKAILTELCGEGWPGQIAPYAGHFAKGDGPQVLHVTACSDNPRHPQLSYAITAGDKVVAAAEFERGPSEVKHIEDLDSDGLSEVVLSGGGTFQGTTVAGAHLIRFAPDPARPAVVADFGQVYKDNLSEPGKGDCIQRVGVIFLDVTDLSRLRRRDYWQPCGAQKSWQPMGPVDVKQTY